MLTARILGTGSYLPKELVTNKELEARVRNFSVDRAEKMLLQKGYDIKNMSNRELFNVWVKHVSGIEQRYFYCGEFDKEPDFIGSSENMGKIAAQRALDASAITPLNLDYIVAATFTQELDIPNPSCSIAHLIGAKEIGGIPINTACCGFLDAIIDAYCRIKSGCYNTILVIATETLSKKTDYDDPKTAILFADGAGATVLQKADTGILGFYSELDYYPDHIVSEKNKPIRMESSLILKKAVESMEKSALKALEMANLELKDVDYIIPHQANQRITDELTKRLKVSQKKVIKTIANFGNTSGASIAVSLDKAVRGEIKGCKIERGQKILFTAVGGGYTKAAVVLEY